MSPSRLTTVLGSLILAFGLATCVRAADKPKAAPKPSPWKPVDPQALDRWKDMRFGMFIHWGPVSLTAKEIGWARGTSVPVEKYDNLYKEFNPTKFHADEWVSIAKEAGMKYIVITAKHHDGFCLWDTKLTDYNIMNSPFKRDVLKELSAACKKQGIGFGTYYSVCDWHHPDFPLTSPGGSKKREKSDLDAYNRYLLGQIKELVTNYGPLVTLWNDVPQMFQGRGKNTIDMVRELQPDIVINDRTGDGGDYGTPEQHVGGFQTNRPWESCMTVSARGQWAWGGDQDGVKPVETCLLMLIRCAGGDGNLLLNVGPEPSGVIAPCQAELLEKMGGVAEGQRRVDLRHPWRPLPADRADGLDPQGQHRLRPRPAVGRQQPEACPAAGQGRPEPAPGRRRGDGDADGRGHRDSPCRRPTASLPTRSSLWSLTSRPARSPPCKGRVTGLGSPRRRPRRMRKRSSGFSRRRSKTQADPPTAATRLAKSSLGPCGWRPTLTSVERVGWLRPGDRQAFALGLQPVNKTNSRNIPEMPSIVRHEDEPMHQGRGGDKKISRRRWLR